MAHQSENSKPLSVRRFDLANLNDLPAPNQARAEVFLFVLPFGRTITDADSSANWFAQLQAFAKNLGEQSLVMILTTPEDAAETWPCISGMLKFQLWIAVKL